MGSAARSRSSAGERPPHTRKVAGSIPAGTTTTLRATNHFGSPVSRPCLTTTPSIIPCNHGMMAVPVALGLRQNAPQFALLVVVNALVGGMLGQERTVLPLLGEQVFGLRAYTAGSVLRPGVRPGQSRDQLRRRHAIRPLRPQTSACRRLAGRSPGAAAVDLGAVLVVGHRGQRASRNQSGPDVVDDRGDEDRPRRSGSPRPGDGSQRGSRLRCRRGDCRGHRLPAPSTTVCARHHSCSESPLQQRDWAYRRCSSRRLTVTPSSKPPPM